MSVNEQKVKKKKKKQHPILNGVAISTIMLFVNTIYNLFLAHIWPVTIHFGDYSLANAIYIMVSVLSSVVISFLAFYFGIYYLLIVIGRGLIGLLSTPEQRAARKRSWLEHTIDAVGFFFLLPFYVIEKLQNRMKPTAKRESAQEMLEKLKKAQPNTEENQ